MISGWAIILAAGEGQRCASAANGIRKQFLEWRDRPLYWHSAMAMSRVCGIDGIVFVFPPEELENQKKQIRALALKDSLGLEWRITPGGKTRAESSRLGLAALPGDCGRVLIHDAARCFVRPALIRAVLGQIGPETPAIVPAIPVADTIKLVNPDQPDLVESSLDRENLRAAQTPQGFHVPALREAQRAGCAASLTDDAMLMELAGYKVRLVAGDAANVKITDPEDLKLLTADQSLMPCCGFGYDVHRYGQGRPLKLGGVAIPGGFEVIAHSDGDVLLHSLIDALLGCAGLGDIGMHFPDSDPRYEGISSAVLLDSALGLVREKGVKIRNVDLTVVAQKPKLAPYADEIRNNAARLLGLAPSFVNFKATTEEGLGFTGTKEGIKAYALACGERAKRI